MGSEDDDTQQSDDGKPLLLQHVQQAEAARSAAVVRAINVHILPIFLAMATLCYIDRTNTAFASLQMNRDLRFSAETYGEQQQQQLRLQQKYLWQQQQQWQQCIPLVGMTVNGIFTT
jgi:hypothetical protein